MEKQKNLIEALKLIGKLKKIKDRQEKKLNQLKSKLGVRR